jgi:hypothetical protein
VQLKVSENEILNLNFILNKKIFHTNWNGDQTILGKKTKKDTDGT